MVARQQRSTQLVGQEAQAYYAPMLQLLLLNQLHSLSNGSACPEWA
jgi:hypothetical protein